jgi:predicted AAA+ superfamily ATPase
MGLWNWFGARRRVQNTFAKGVRAEKLVAAKLRQKGYRVRINPGSRGAEDVRAYKKARKLYVQVKSGTARLTSEGKARLRRVAKRVGAIPMHMHVMRGKIKSRFV